MLTEATTRVDPPPDVMWTVSQVAERDGVSKQAVSRKVRDLAETHGLTVLRNQQGHIVRLNVAEYDHLRGRYGDPSKLQAPVQRPDVGPHRESYDEALRLKTSYDAEKSRLAVEELKGQLVRVIDLNAALSLAGETIVRIIDGLANEADELAAAVGRDGPHGARVHLKSVVQRQRTSIATALRAIRNTEFGEASAEKEITSEI